MNEDLCSNSQTNANVLCKADAQRSSLLSPTAQLYALDPQDEFSALNRPMLNPQAFSPRVLFFQGVMV
jgi:hypothetical protein